MRVTVVMAVTLLFVIMILFYANWKIPHDTQHYVFDNVDSIPEQRVALVLGASKVLSNGLANPYFTKRINAARQLYEKGKVKAFVVSGDNGEETYNEPEDMRNALIEAGVPDSVIYLDYAGFRTLDSVVRMSKVFGQNSFIVVSQRFHNERAVFLAQHYNLTAYGYNAADVIPGRISYRTIIREKFARVKVFLDLALGIQPKFLGANIDIK